MQGATFPKQCQCNRSYFGRSGPLWLKQPAGEGSLEDESVLPWEVSGEFND